MQTRREKIEKVLARIGCRDYRFVLSPGCTDGGAYFLHLEYEEADIHTGLIETQRTRRWLIEHSDSETKIVETCWAAVQRSMLHRAAESFKYKDQRVYSPHFSIDARLMLCDHDEFDE